MSKTLRKKKEPESKSFGFTEFVICIFVAYFIFTIVRDNYLFEMNSRNVVYSKAVVEKKVFRPQRTPRDRHAGCILSLKYDCAGKTYHSEIYVGPSDYDQIEIGDSTNIKYNVTHPGIIISEIQCTPVIGTRGY